MTGPDTEIEVLITVKTYPRPSTTYGESVCIAGIRLDTPAPQWCRLFPVDFRALPKEQQFHKYDIVRCIARRPRVDPRPESLCPIVHTIEVVGSLPSWRDRWPHLRPLALNSMCELRERQRESGTSLGMFRPGPVTGFHVEAAAPWDEGRNASLDQQSLLAVRRARRLEQIPYAFSFSYRCEDAACSGHRQQMIDWELGQNYRNTNGFDEARRLELVRERWLDQVCRADRETFFFAGNHSQHPGSFMLLGAFWPRKRELQRLERPELALF